MEKNTKSIYEHIGFQYLAYNPKAPSFRFLGKKENHLSDLEKLLSAIDSQGKVGRINLNVKFNYNIRETKKIFRYIEIPRECNYQKDY